MTVPQATKRYAIVNIQETKSQHLVFSYQKQLTDILCSHFLYHLVLRKHISFIGVVADYPVRDPMSYMDCNNEEDAKYEDDMFHLMPVGTLKIHRKDLNGESETLIS